MKRVGRRGRVLGTVKLEGDMLDDGTQKHLLQAAGISMDVLDEMSDEERKQTLAAILESNPVLLKNCEQGIFRSDGAQTAPSSQRPDPCTKETLRAAAKDMARGQASGSPQRRSAKHILDSEQATRYEAETLHEETHRYKTETYVETQRYGTKTSDEKSLRYEAKISDEETQRYEAQISDEETQRYDAEICSEETQRYEAKICDEETQRYVAKICDEETQRFAAGLQRQNAPQYMATEAQRLSQEDTVNPVGHRREQGMSTSAENCDFPPSVYFRLEPSTDRGQESLSGIYRKHLKQHKMIFSPSFYTPQHINTPDGYTQVIKLMLQLYRNRFSRACKHTAEGMKAWGKPVTAGHHSHGCLVARHKTMLENDSVHDRERAERRTLRSRLHIDKQGQTSFDSRPRRRVKDLEESDVTLGSSYRQHLEDKDSQNKLNCGTSLGTSYWPSAPDRLTKNCQWKEEDTAMEKECETNNDRDGWLSVRTLGAKGNSLNTNGKRKQPQVSQSKEYQKAWQVNAQATTKECCFLDGCDTVIPDTVIPYTVIAEKCVGSEKDNESCDLQDICWLAGKSAHLGTDNADDLGAILATPQTQERLSRDEASVREGQVLSTFIRVSGEEESSHERTPNLFECADEDGSGNCSQTRSAALVSQSSQSLLDANGNLYGTQMCSAINSLLLETPASSLHRHGRAEGSLGGSSRNINHAQSATGTKSVGQKAHLLKAQTSASKGHSEDGSTQLSAIDYLQVSARREADNDLVAKGSLAGNTRLRPQTLPTNSHRKRNLLAVTRADPDKSRTLGKKRKVTRQHFEESSHMFASMEGVVESAVVTSLEEANQHIMMMDKDDFPGSQEGVIVCDNLCPLCGKSFPPSLLETHASSCGEELPLEAGQGEHTICAGCKLQLPSELLWDHQAICTNRHVPEKRITRSTKE